MAPTPVWAPPDLQYQDFTITSPSFSAGLFSLARRPRTSKPLSRKILTQQIPQNRQRETNTPSKSRHIASLNCPLPSIINDHHRNAGSYRYSFKKELGIFQGSIVINRREIPGRDLQPIYCLLLFIHWLLHAITQVAQRDHRSHVLLDGRGLIWLSQSGLNSGPSMVAIGSGT